MSLLLFLLLVLLVLCRAAFTPHNRTLEVRPGKISKMLELDYDYDVKGVAVFFFFKVYYDTNRNIYTNRGVHCIAKTYYIIKPQ